MFSNQTPSINATSGIYGNGTQAYTPQNPSLVFNINSNNSPSPTFIPMNNSTFQPGGSGGFSSPSNGSLQTPRDILTRQQLIFYFCHSSVCLVKNGNNAKGPMGASSNCKVPYCPESKHVLQHLQLCPNSRICGVSSCLGLRWARDHYSNCKNMSCVMCEPVRKNRAGNYFITSNESSLIINFTKVLSFCCHSKILFWLNKLKYEGMLKSKRNCAFSLLRSILTTIVNLLSCFSFCLLCSVSTEVSHP